MLGRIIRQSYIKHGALTCSPITVPRTRYFCDKKDDQPEKETLKKSEDKSEKKDDKIAAASNRLNQLLAGMAIGDGDNITSGMKKNVQIQQPNRFNRKKLNQKVTESTSSSSSSSDSSSDDDGERPKNIVEAAKKVANVMQGDKKQTEMELLSKLLGISVKKDGEKANLSDVISGMQVSKDNPLEAQPERGRAEFVRRTMDHQDQRSMPPMRSRPRMGRSTEFSSQSRGASVKLFGSDPLGIFTGPLKPTEDFLETWAMLEKREQKLAVTHPPSNYFEKMALWTEQGKIWQFPINNEQGMLDEANVDFTEHVFLEDKLEPWCPKMGPVRHFMELVIVGLSKNPYLSVKDKHDHIEYYRNYFESKKEMLQQIIVDNKSEEAKELEAK